MSYTLSYCKGCGQSGPPGLCINCNNILKTAVEEQKPYVDAAMREDAQRSAYGRSSTVDMVAHQLRKGLISDLGVCKIPNHVTDLEVKIKDLTDAIKELQEWAAWQEGIAQTTLDRIKSRRDITLCQEVAKRRIAMAEMVEHCEALLEGSE